ncbi:MAG: NAD(P)H oxidoreductase, partial [Cytophagales bacterium]|nr:NAD(P)H oxidoreductase [Cytophagales bacterium]
MKNILILFAHPRFEQSRAQQALVAAASTIEGVSLRDLYELYPDFNIDVEAEKEILLAHEV